MFFKVEMHWHIFDRLLRHESYQAPLLSDRIADLISFRETINRGTYALSKRDMFGDNSVSLRRNWMKLGGNFSYKPRGASYTAQGP